MELTKLLFNNLNVSSNGLQKNSDSLLSFKSDDKFENYLNNVSNKASATSYTKKQNSSSVKSNSNSDKSTKNDLKETKAEKSNNVNNSDKKIDSKNKSEISDELKDVVNEKETELKEEIAEILGVSTDAVENALEQLGINIFELSNPNDMLNFLQIVFNVDDVSDLLSVAGIKDTILTLKQTIEDTIEAFKNLGFENVQEIIDAFNELNSDMENVYDAFQQDDVNVNSQTDFEDTQQESVNSNVENATKQGAVKSDDVSLRNKNKENIQLDDAVIEDSEVNVENIKASETTDMHNGYNQQQGFQNNQNGMSFESNQQNINNGMSVSTFENINKAFSNVISKNEAMKNVNTADVINQIIEKFKTGILKSDVSEIKMTLKPDYLGDVALKIVSENGIVSAQFTAENEKVKEIIESNFNSLKDMLNEQGVQVSSLSVSVGSDDTANERQHFGFEQNKSSRRINDIINAANDEESEVDNVEYINEDDVLQTNVNYTA